MSEDPATYEHPVTPLGRTARSLLWRRWPEFVIDGWVQDRKDRLTEVAYLELLSEDLAEIEEELGNPI